MRRDGPAGDTLRCRREGIEIQRRGGVSWMSRAAGPVGGPANESLRLGQERRSGLKCCYGGNRLEGAAVRRNRGV